LYPPATSSARPTAPAAIKVAAVFLDGAADSDDTHDRCVLMPMSGEETSSDREPPRAWGAAV
jgi:hypothetical protein